MGLFVRAFIQGGLSAPRGGVTGESRCGRIIETSSSPWQTGHCTEAWAAGTELARAVSTLGLPLSSGSSTIVTKQALSSRRDGKHCRRTVNGIELFTLGWSGPHASARRSAARAAGRGWEGDTPRLRRPTGRRLAGGRPAALPTAPGEVVLRTRQGAAGDQAQRWPLGPCHPKSLGGAGSGAVLPPGTWDPGCGTQDVGPGGDRAPF